MGLKRKSPRKILKGEDFYVKKLHACKVNLRRAIKKAKDLQVRTIVKRLKREKVTGNSNKEADLEKELHQIKGTKLDAIWKTLCDARGVENLDKSNAFYNKSLMIKEQLEKMKNLMVKMEEAREGIPDEKQGAEKVEGKVDNSGRNSSEDLVREIAKQGEERKLPKKPKNRMGQRARQRLAEKLHGPAAKHREKGRSEKPTTKLKDKNVSEVPLHPSWIAKKQQESIKIDLNSVSSKKIVFD